MRSSRVTAFVVASTVVSACSFTADFDRYASAWNEDAGIGGGGEAGAPDADAGASSDASSDGGAGSYGCAVADPQRIFCSPFDGPAVTTGWTKLIVDDAPGGDTATIDTSQSLSPPSSARFFVGAGVDRYAELLNELPLAPLPDAVEAFGHFRIDELTTGSVALLELSLDDEKDSLSVYATSSQMELKYKGQTAFDKVPLGAVPIGRFFTVVIRRDDGSSPRTVTVEIDGMATGSAHPLEGARPAATRFEVRTGIVFAENHHGSMTVWADDVGLRRR